MNSRVIVSATNAATSQSPETRRTAQAWSRPRMVLLEFSGPAAPQDRHREIHRKIVGRFGHSLRDGGEGKGDAEQEP